MSPELAEQIATLEALGPDALAAVNGWLGAFSRKSGIRELTPDGGRSIRLPWLRSDGTLRGELSAPGEALIAVGLAGLADPDAAEWASHELEQPRGFIVAIITAAAAIVSATIGYFASSNARDAAADQRAAAAEAARVEREKLAAAQRMAAAQLAAQQEAAAQQTNLILAAVAAGLAWYWLRSR